MFQTMTNGIHMRRRPAGAHVVIPAGHFVVHKIMNTKKLEM